MAATRNGRGGQAWTAGNLNNKQAQLGNAYQELGRELGTEVLKVVGGYTLGRVIGEGTYGSVHLAVHRLTGTRCAIKKIPKSATANLTREIHHHRRLHHPHIVHLHEIVATETHVWLVSELCSGGELFDYLVERGRLPESEARRLFGELTVAVGWLHQQGVVHRDLKLENVLLDGELRVKLGDLGFARECQRGKLLDTYCGTTGYASPEMLAGRKYLGAETDIWSLGIILYTLLCGGLPFDDDDDRVMKDLIIAGDYEEPEWLSEEARALIRALLQQDPLQRISIEGILTHPWFKMTIIDQPNTTEGLSLPPTPLLGSLPETEQAETVFNDSFATDPSQNLSRLHPIPLQSSPLNAQDNSFPPDRDWQHSETSLDLADSEEGRAGTSITTPSTVEDEGDKALPRTHSGEFSQTERVLEMLHPNASQSTIRRTGDTTPNSLGAKSRAAARTNLEGQAEVDEEIAELEGGDASSPMPEDHSLHLPLAQHSRTPSRTKRRSVSSTLSLERRLSHRSSSGHWQPHTPEDYLSQLHAEQAGLFTRAAEKHLLNQLSALGIDTGQLIHSVTSDACDASAAMWWILRIKQLDRGETDETVKAMNASAARRRDRAAAYAREERRKAREKEKSSREASRDASREGSPVVRTPEVKFINEPTSIPFTTPKVTLMDLGSPIVDAIPSLRVVASPETIPMSPSASDVPQLLVPEMAAVRREEAVQKSAPQTPPRDSKTSTPRSDLLASPTDSIGSPNNRERLKSRSPSMSMLQRATSALTGGNKRAEEKEKPHVPTQQHMMNEHEVPERRPEGRTSPTRLVKPHPKPKLPKSDSEGNLLIIPHNSPASSMTVTSPTGTPSRLEAESLRRQLPTMPASLPEGSTGDGDAASAHQDTGKGKLPKRDSLWATFRHIFNEDRRRRKRDSSSPLTLIDNQIKIAPTVILSRGPAARSPHVNRQVNPSSRRASLDVRPTMQSRRSSSVNSRRSSITSAHMPADLHDSINALGRRTSHRSHGSQTPTSDREYTNVPEYPSRPGSAHSIQRGSSRRSSTSMHLRSPSLHSESSGRFRNPPASPLHNYQRRPPSGSASTRVRHFKVIPEAQVLRSSSVASSIRSNNSSRASSIDRDRSRLDDLRDESDYDTGREDASSISTYKRRREDRKGSAHSLAQQIHRTRSPLAHSAIQHHSHKHHSSSGLKPKAPLRDVFQQKDDEWVDEDDGASFAGGLGQSSSKTVWHEGRRTDASSVRASTHPGVMSNQTARKRNHQPKAGEDVHAGKKASETRVEKDNTNSGTRRGMSERSGKPPIVMEEVEEEDEE